MGINDNFLEKYKNGFRDFRRIDLARKNWEKINLQGSNFSHSNLSGINLCQSNLSQTKLIWTDLNGAILRKANFTESYLTGVTQNLNIVSRIIDD